MSFLIGALLAFFVGVFARRMSFDQDRSFYPTVLIVIASYYALFSAMGGSLQSLLAECVVMIPFLVASMTGFHKTHWLVVAGLAAHGVFDLVHPYVMSNPGVPIWWPNFCLAYDLVAACCLATLLMRRKVTR